LSLFEPGPGARALGFFARQARFAVAVFEGIQRHLDGVADLDVEFAVFIVKLFDRDNAFGLEARIDDNNVPIDIDNFAGDDFTDAHIHLGNALLEHFCKVFRHG
jgi:hypothetical protein